jgi:hypothetical protein
MDDFDQTYLEGHRHFEAGRIEGAHEAEEKDLTEEREEGRLFGEAVNHLLIQFGKELALYDAYLSVFKDAVLSSNRAKQLALELQEEL